MSKFTVTISTPEKFDGEYAYVIVSNKIGRRWITKNYAEYGNACENAMIIEEMINGGEKLIKGDWNEIDGHGNVIYYA
jgi:hypothetical protein